MYTRPGPTLLEPSAAVTLPTSNTGAVDVKVPPVPLRGSAAPATLQPQPVEASKDGERREIRLPSGDEFATNNIFGGMLGSDKILRSLG